MEARLVTFDFDLLDLVLDAGVVKFTEVGLRDPESVEHNGSEHNIEKDNKQDGLLVGGLVHCAHLLLDLGDDHFNFKNIVWFRDCFK